MNYSLCIEMLFPEIVFEDRIESTKKAGFSVVEFWCWWEHNLNAVIKACREQEVSVSAICTRFIALTDPKQADAYVEGLIETIEVANKLNCPNIVSHIGCNIGQSRESQRANIVDTLKSCVPYMRESGRTLLLEPVNRGEIPDYFVTGSDEAADIIREIGSASVKMLFDVYHQQLSEGSIIHHLRRNIDVIGHIHAAGVPERAELDDSEINYCRIIQELKELGYDQYIGLEYIPKKATSVGLSHLPELSKKNG